MAPDHILPDLLAPDLTLIFCGSAVGAVSARRGLPYAGPGNKFWPVLYETGLTPRLFAPADWRALLALGIGMTDLNKTESGADSTLSKAADDPAALSGKIARLRPRILAFTAKRPAQSFLKARFGRGRIDYGRQDAALGDTEIWVLPSPSGLAIRYWDTGPWHDLASRYRAARAG